MHPEITDVLAVIGIPGLLVAMTWGIYALLPPSPPKPPKPPKPFVIREPETAMQCLLRGLTTILLLEIFFGDHGDH